MTFVTFTDTELLQLFKELKDAIIKEGGKADKNFRFAITKVFYESDIPGVSLNHLLRNTSPSKEYIEHIYDNNVSINCRKFYNTYLQVSKHNKKEADIEEPLAIAICKFIGYEDVEHFLEQFKEELKKFKGLFYSPKSNQVIEYDLSIQKTGDKFKLEETGIHESSVDRVFTGEGHWNSNSWVLEARLTSKKGEPIYFLINMSREELISQDFLEAITLTVTTALQLPVAFYSLLISEDRFEALTGREKKYIKRYMMIRQDIFSVGNTTISGWQDLAIRGREMELLNPMVGVFEVWRFTEQQEILITRLQIDEDFKGKLQNAVLSEDQIKEFDCKFDLSTGRISRLCVTILQDRNRRNPLVFALIDLVSRLEDRGQDKKYYFGSFCSISNNKIEARPMVLMRRDFGYERFQSELISYREAIAKSEESYQHYILLDKLKEITKDYDVDFPDH